MSLLRHIQITHCIKYMSWDTKNVHKKLYRRLILFTITSFDKNKKFSEHKTDPKSYAIYTNSL